MGDLATIIINDTDALITIFPAENRLSESGTDLFNSFDHLIFSAVVGAVSEGQDFNIINLQDAHAQYQTLGVNHMVQLGNESMPTMSFMLADDNQTVILRILFRNMDLAERMIEFVASIEFL